MEKTEKPKKSYGKCGECLWHRVKIVDLDEHGKCPKCGTDYSTHVTETNVKDTG